MAERFYVYKIITFCNKVDFDALGINVHLDRLDEEEIIEAGNVLDQTINEFTHYLDDKLAGGWEPVSHSLSFVGNLSILSILAKKSSK